MKWHCMSKRKLKNLICLIGKRSLVCCRPRKSGRVCSNSMGEMCRGLTWSNQLAGTRTNTTMCRSYHINSCSQKICVRTLYEMKNDVIEIGHRSTQRLSAKLAYKNCCSLFKKKDEYMRIEMPPSRTHP